MYQCQVDTSIFIIIIFFRHSTTRALNKCNAWWECLGWWQLQNFMSLFATVIRPQQHKDAFVTARLDDTLTPLLRLCVHSTSTKPGSSTEWVRRRRGSPRWRWSFKFAHFIWLEIRKRRGVRVFFLSQEREKELFLRLHAGRTISLIIWSGKSSALTGRMSRLPDVLAACLELLGHTLQLQHKRGSMCNQREVNQTRFTRAYSELACPEKE